jgi:hypothetical protein
MRIFREISLYLVDCWMIPIFSAKFRENFDEVYKPGCAEDKVIGEARVGN